MGDGGVRFVGIGEDASFCAGRDLEAHSRARAEHRTLGEMMECRRRAGVPTMPAQHAAMNLGWTWQVLRRTGMRRRKVASAKDTDLPM